VCSEPATPIELLQLATRIYAKDVGAVAAVEAEGFGRRVEIALGGLSRGHCTRCHQNQGYFKLPNHNWTSSLLRLPCFESRPIFEEIEPGREDDCQNARADLSEAA
jgi:hypothetical protein